MVLLHHEVVVEFPNGRPTENHQATLLEFGRTQNGKEISAMALTVGIPVAIGALVCIYFNYVNILHQECVWCNYKCPLILQLILAKKITSTGVLRPIDPEVYEPGKIPCLFVVTVLLFDKYGYGSKCISILNLVDR